MALKHKQTLTNAAAPIELHRYRSNVKQKWYKAYYLYELAGYLNGLSSFMLQTHEAPYRLDNTACWTMHLEI